MRNAARGLNRIDDQNAARGLDDLGDAIDRLDDAGLVVGGMDRHQRQAIGLVMTRQAPPPARRDRRCRWRRRRCASPAPPESARHSSRQG